MRILVVNVNWMGDALFSTPALRALRKRYPKDHIACLVPPRCEAVLRGNPSLDEVIVADDRDNLFSFFSSLKTAFRLRSKRFDLAIFFHRSISKRLMALLAGISERKGFETPEKKRFFLTAAVSIPPEEMHRTDFFLRILSGHGIPPDGREPDFFPAQAAAEELTHLLKETNLTLSGGYAVIHPGGNWDLKRWPVEHFAEWIQLFLERHPSRKVILCGTEPEKKIADQILKKVRSERLVSFCGRTTLDTLAFLLRGADFLLSNDSGPIHLAASQKTPIVGLYGPTSARLTGPLSEGRVLILSKDVGCQVPCYYRACDSRFCLDWIKPREVFESIEAWTHAASS